MAGTSIKKAGIDPTTSATTGTFSFWVKFHNARTDGNDYFLFSSYDDANSRMHIKIDGSGNLDINERISSSTSINLITDMEYRDISGWYHFVIAINTTQATAADRVKVYVNGEQITNFSTETYPSQNEDIHCLQGNKVHYLGCYGGNVNSANYCLDGSMSHCHFADGQQYAASVFGETDTTTGEWKIKTEPTVTYGNNGWFIFKDNSALTNHAGNSAGNFVLDTGTITKCEDSPSNVFATLNPLSSLSNLTYANGSLQVTGASSNVWKTTFSSIGMMYGKAGKFYCEMKVSTLNSQAGIGVWGQPLPATTTSNYFPNHHQYGFVYKEDGSVSDDSQTFYTGSSFTSGDIIQCALDLTNSKIYFGKNGTWQNSGDPTSGSTGTGAVALEDNGDFYFFTASSYGTDVLQMNFGNGYFGTTAISSEGTNASGIGKFEYDVPTGYTALSTNGLNE